MTEKKTNYLGPFLTLVFLFFVVGFLTTANTQFQAPLKEAFLANAGRFQNTFATLITFSWFLAYPLAGPVGSRWVNRHGYKGTLLRGIAVMLLGLFLFFASSWYTVRFEDSAFRVGQAVIPVGFVIFLLGSFIVGASATILQVVINPYLTACDVPGTQSVQRLAIGGTMLSLLIFLLPPLFGEGYGSINLLLNGRTEADWNHILDNSLFAGQGAMLIPYIALVLFTKVLATSATNGGGGCGGTFAPSLFIGCFTGFLFSRLWNIHDIGVYVPEKNFALLGMAGVMSGVMHAPLTGVFLIAELTGGYSMFMPLMIVSVCAYLTIIMFEPHSIYGYRLARQGKLLTHHTDHAALTLMNLDSVIEKDFLGVTPDMELGQIVQKISRSHSSVLPVMDAGGMLLGEIDILKIRSVVFRIELYHHFKASQLMTEPKALLSDATPMADVMRTFERTGANWLPVLDAESRLKGYISRQRLYTLYRKMVHDMSED